MTKTSKRSGKVTVARAAFFLAAALGAPGCGGVQGSDVVNARNQATTASCNYFKMCNEIGPGLQYDTYQDCITQVQGNWTNGWPTTTCQGHIDQQALMVCIASINSTTDCNGLAELIALSKCGSGMVCGANVTDAGGGN